MVIQVDTRQKMGQKHHQIKEKWFVDNGHTVVHSKCLVGDYVCPSNGSVAVDTKQSITELYGNLISDHRRFHDECVLAMECGVKLIILIENKDGITKPDEIVKWDNPQMRKYWSDKRKGINRKPPASNVQLLKIMHSMHRDYGVDFQFCKTEEAGQRIVELLGEKIEQRMD